MPRENRKRGKKNKAKQVEQTQEDDYHTPSDHLRPDDGLHVFSRGDRESGSEDLPFGTLDPDVKAYFRTVDDQLRDWQHEKPRDDVEADVDPNEERRMFFTAALSEMNGRELQLATDPDCSPILERMLYSMDDFVRRVFTDSLAGSWLQLIANRFASHVCQTLFTVVAGTIARENRGILPSPPISDDNRGELLTMTQLVLNACEDIAPELPRLIQSPYASHVLRALLLLLAPSQLALSHSHSHRHAPSARSKKSASWKARHGPMKAVIISQPGIDGAAGDVDLSVPSSFSKMAARFVDKIRSELGGNEVRALAVDKVSSPSLQMLLELEAAVGRADIPESLMDHVLTGLVTDSHFSLTSSASSYVSALILDTTSSHLLESIFSCCSSAVFDRLWDCYVRSDLPKLAVHPVANFVVARGMRRLDEQRLEDSITRLESTWSRCFKLSRIGVLTAMIDRACEINTHEAELVEATCSMIGVNTDEERQVLVPCIIQLKTRTEYHNILSGGEASKEVDDDSPDRLRGPKRNGTGSQDQLPPEPKIQGSILLQSLLRLHEPYNRVVLDSLYSLLPAELLALAQNATSSRIFDAALESPTVPLRSRKRLVTAFIGHYHLLVDDRIGSRVADRCWEVADPYLKEKIARSLIPHEQFLAGSHFGRFFARNLSLPLLQRKPDQWKTLQSTSRPLLTNTNAIPTTHAKPPPRLARDAEGTSILTSPDSNGGMKRKRKDTVGGDAIDALFSGIGAKKKAKGIAEIPTETHVSVDEGDTTLDAVLGAIKAAPSDSRRKRQKR